MNNTLTGFGLALVLALVAALIGPWFINWTAYRDDFAAQASALVGAPVKVTGAVDARLLPTPYVRFRGLTAGAGASRLSVDEVELELAIAPLFKGEVRAERIKLVRARVGVEVLADGAVRTAFSSGRKASSSPNRFSFDRAEIADGAIVAATASGEVTLDRIAGFAEAGSLAGPFKFEGAWGPAGRRTQARLSTTRAEAGTMRLKISLQQDGRPETVEADGALAIAAKPGFSGKVSLSRPPPRRARDDAAARDAPWRAAAEVKADFARVALANIDLAYGPEDRAVRLGGRGEATLGRSPAFDFALDARQVDLDRILGDDRPRTPAGMASNLVERLGAIVRPPFDGRLKLDVRSVVLAGDVVQDLAADLRSEDGGWRVRQVSAALPAGAKISASGAVAFVGDDPGFAGVVDFSSPDLAGFRRWLAGGGDAPGALIRRLGLKGEVTANATAASIEDAELTVDGARSTGRLAWLAGRNGARDRIEAALATERLDLDALGVDRILSQALSGGDVDMLLALDAKALIFSGVQMDDVSIDGSAGADGVDLRRLEIRDVGGATVSGAGLIASGRNGPPQGRLSFDVAATRLTALLALARAAGAPEAAVAALQARAGALTPVKLELDIDADATGERFKVSGDAAGGRLDARLATEALSLDARADLALKLVSGDGRRLAALIGLDVSPVVQASGGDLTLTLSGAPAKGMSGEGRFLALGVDLSGRGALAFAPVVGLSAEGDVRLISDDVTAFAEASGRLIPGAAPHVPASLNAYVAFGAEAARIDRLDGAIAGTPVRGRIFAPYDPAKPIEAELGFDELPAAAVAALVLSPAALQAGPDAGGLWPAEPFGPALARGLTGTVAVSAARLPLGAGRTATDATFKLALRPTGMTVDTFSGGLDGGRLTGSATVVRSGDDATIAFAASLEDASAESLTGLAGSASPVMGAVDLRMEAQGAGRSLAAVVAGLTGAGNVTLRDATVRRLDASAIDRVEPLVEAGLALDAARVTQAVARAIDRADLRLDRAAAPFTLSGGVARTGAISAATPTARLGGGVAFDLRRLVLDADLTLQPNRPDAPQIAVSFEGPLSAPIRRIDATGLTGWLSVRAVERETRRIEAMEADIQDRARIARLRFDEDRRRLDEEKRRADEDRKRVEDERRKIEAERRKRDAEARALADTPPKPSNATAPGLPSEFDISPPPSPAGVPNRPAAPPAGVFGGPGGR